MQAERPRRARERLRCAADGPSAHLAFEEELNDFRRDRAGSLIELRVGQIRDRVLHHEEPELRQAPRARHRLAGGGEHVRDDRGRRYTVLFEHYAVEDTPRRT